MGRHHQRLARALELAKEAQQPLARALVEPIERLVKAVRVGVHGEHAGDGHLLLLAAGEVVGRAATQVVDAQKLAHVAHAASHLVLAELHLAWPKGDLLLHACAEQLGVGVLEDEAHALVQPLRERGGAHALGIHGLAVKQVGALLREHEPAHGLEQRRLARAVVAHENHGVAGVDGEVDVREGGALLVRKAEVAKLHEGA